MSEYQQEVAPKGDKYERQWEALGAWFMGPKAENKELFLELAQRAITAHTDFREEIYPTDPVYINQDIKSSRAYRTEVEQLKRELDRINKDLSRVVPFFSWRYQGHMNWDTNLPANIGYLTGLLYNQNNVAAEGGPITTLMEIEVGNQLCQMLGYNTDTEKTPVSWGHITCGGTVANIEAVWAARNLKFHPLAVKKAIKEDGSLSKSFKVFVPGSNKEKKLVDLDTWDLLNLRIDDVIDMTNKLATESNVSIEEASALIKKYNVESVGLAEIMRENDMTKSPVVLTPASNHYSWPKSLTLLGLGDANLLNTEVEETGRQSLDSMKKILNDCLKNKIPVIAVVGVMGTTEEGAIDPMQDIYNMKKDFEKKGLCYSLHADGAWGGYMCSMLGKDTKKGRKTIIGKGYVSSSPLNEHSKKNLDAIKLADSITLDPHKTGLTPYPGGGLCYRNGLMRNFVTLTAPVVFHGGNDPNIGVYGIEGSKPGAAAVSTLLAHRVIGLDEHGYGRIMSQCISGSKLFYCMWLVVARDDDPFVCQPLLPLPPRMTVEIARKFIQKNMLGKSFEDMMQNKKTADFLGVIGGDAMVNPFIINIKGNTDPEVANKLVMAVFKRLSHSNATKKNVKKTPMICTQSEKSKSIGVETLRKLKKRMGLDDSNDDINLSFMINTVLNPWMTSFELVQQMGNYLREAVLLAIGDLQDDPHNHGFISMGDITDDGVIMGDHLPVFTESVHQYHAIGKFRFLDNKAVKLFREKQDEQKSVPKEERKPVIFGNPNVMSLPSLMDSNGRRIEMDCFVGLPSETNPAFQTTTAVVEEIVRFSHFDMTADSYPEKLQYFLCGDENGTYLSHIMTKRPDMHQVVMLDKPPFGVPKELISEGMLITIPELPGEPFMIGGQQTDPLQANQYTFQYVGKYGKVMQSTLDIAGDGAKIWTDFRELNVDHDHNADDNMGAAIARSTTMRLSKSSGTSVDKLIDTNLRKYYTKDADYYGLDRTGYDPNAPAQPGDIISLKDNPAAKMTVDVVMEDKKVIGITTEDKKKGFVKYSDVVLIQAGDFKVPFALTD